MISLSYMKRLSFKIFRFNCMHQPKHRVGRFVTGMMSYLGCCVLFIFILHFHRIKRMLLQSVCICGSRKTWSCISMRHNIQCSLHVQQREAEKQCQVKWALDLSQTDEDDAFLTWLHYYCTVPECLYISTSSSPTRLTWWARTNEPI